MASESRELFVVAIDFGTSQTGYAYSLRNAFKTDPLRMYGMMVGPNQLLTKVPSSVLFNQNEEFVSFGSEAEERYAEICSEDTNWRLFKDIKMRLYNTGKQKTRRDMIIEDSRGQPLAAIKVISPLLRYLKEQFLKKVEESCGGVKEDEIRWVITVPAIWDDTAKQFMREAAEQAGMKTSNLTLGLEPECAALYSKYHALELRKTLKEPVLQAFQPGSMYLLLDLGGGTTDITAHKVREDDSLEELCAANGGPWGGDSVNMEFRNYMSDIFSKDHFLNFCKNHQEEAQEINSEFEKRKRKCSLKYMKDNKYMSIKLPEQLLKHFPSETDSSLASLQNNRLQIPIEQVKRFFNSTLIPIKQHIEKTLATHKDLQNIKNVIFVGGFSVCDIVQEELKALFPKEATNFICPNNAELATLMGAVIYGQTKIKRGPERGKHKSPVPQTPVPTPGIYSRICRYSYGIDIHKPFDAIEHPSDKKFKDGEQCFCKDVFGLYFKSGTKLKSGNKALKKSVSYNVDKNALTLDINIYRTENPNPRFIDEPDCCELGKLVIDMHEDVGDPDREVKVDMQVVDTELTVNALNVRNNRQIKATFDILR